MSDTTRRSARRICACDAAHSQDSTQARAPATDPAGRPAVRSHTEAVAVASDATLFSSRVSRFLQVPNGLDGEEHRMMRGLLAPFFFPAALKELQPRLEKTAARLIETRRPERALCAVHELGSLYAVRAQSTWLGWCPEIEDELVEWVKANHEATRSGALERTREVARWFDRIMRDLIAQRRQTDVAHDVTWRLTRLRRLNGTPVSDDEIVSILRNWTGGDLSSRVSCFTGSSSAPSTRRRGPLWTIPPWIERLTRCCASTTPSPSAVAWSRPRRHWPAAQWRRASTSSSTGRAPTAILTCSTTRMSTILRATPSATSSTGRARTRVRAVRWPPWSYECS